MEELKTTSAIINEQMSSLISFVRSMDTTMDDRLFSYNKIVSECIKALNNLDHEVPRSMNDILTDIISIALPLNNISELFFMDAQSLVSAILFKHKGRDAISRAAFQRLEQNASLLTALKHNKKTLNPGALYEIKDKAYVILGPLSLGTDYWIYDQDSLEQRKTMVSIPAFRLSELMPLHSSDFCLKGFLQLEPT